jgi:adenosylcobinamide-GDP ribazoletransferase
VRDALGFLTIFPVGGRTRPPGKAALLAFPLVGLFIGITWASIGWAASRIWPATVAAGLVLLADLILTGGLHADALADLADGIASRKPPDEAIAIMRDPSTGAVGAASLIVAMLIRFAFITALIPSHPVALIAAPVAGRLSMVWLMSRAQVAGPSLAADLAASASIPVALGATLISAPIAWITAGPKGMTSILLGIVTAQAAAPYFKHRLGGLTGDAVGATSFLTELAALAVLSAFSSPQ